MRKLFALIGLLSLFVFSTTSVVYADHPEIEEITVIKDGNEIHHNVEEVHEEHGGGGHGLEPLFFIIIALIIGAAVRHFFRNIPLPFTVILLLIGIGLGTLNMMEYFGGVFELFAIVISGAGLIDRTLCLYLFFPTFIC